MSVRAPFERAGVAEVLQAAAAEGGRFRFHLRGMQTVVEFSFTNGKLVPNSRDVGTLEKRLMLLALAEQGEIERLGSLGGRDSSTREVPAWLPTWWTAEQRAHILLNMLERVGLGLSQRLWPHYQQMMASPDLPDYAVSILRTVDGEKSVAELAVMGAQPPEMIVNVLAQMLEEGFISTHPLSMPRMVEPFLVQPAGMPSRDEYTGPVVRREIQQRLISSVDRGSSASQLVEAAFTATFYPTEKTADKAWEPLRHNAWPRWFWLTAFVALLLGAGLALCETPYRLLGFTPEAPSVSTSTVSVSLPTYQGAPLVKMYRRKS
ncbi:MAG: hypothetical protein KTR25_18005 [Myxococcales bacterium]|nr:hypothetical protein [Myxococcales bacterium]